MTQTGQCLCFSLESRFQFGLIGNVLSKNLDRNRAAEAFVAGSIHFAHSTGANWRHDFVRAQLRSAS
jgi:hypothetical protein